MRIVVLGGTRFVGRRLVERLVERGDRVLAVHRGVHDIDPMNGVTHLHTDRSVLAEHVAELHHFAPEAVVDAIALTGQDVAAVPAVLGELPAVVLSSQDVYRAASGLRQGRCTDPVPLTEDAVLRSERRPYRGLDLPDVPEDYEKLDVEEGWRARGATVLRLPMVYGPHDWQRRENIVLRRLRAVRTRIPVGPANLLWTRGHVDDIVTAVIAALDMPRSRGLTLNLGEIATWSLRGWFEQIIAAAGSAVELVEVPESTLPADLALTGAAAQHLVISTERARAVLGLLPEDIERRVAESVRWHLDNPPRDADWTEQDARADDAALAAARR